MNTITSIIKNRPSTIKSSSNSIKYLFKKIFKNFI